MGKKYDYDYIIIGSGPAGCTAALSLANPKRKIALVEGGKFGGSNLSTRDIPYAISLDFSHTLSKLISYPEINRHGLHFNFPTVVAHQNYTISTIANLDAKSIKEAGITYFQDNAYFLDPHTVAIKNKQVTSANFIIATGATPTYGNIHGIDTAKFFTPYNIIKAKRIPKFILVVGGGASGCEIAEYFAELGSKVIILERENRLLPREDKETGAALAEYFTRRFGIMVITDADVIALEPDGPTTTKVTFKLKKEEKTIRIDCVVLATGSAPNTDLGLENAGVKYTESGIKVNRTFQTSARNIYAIGDCIGGESSTERAEYQASVLVSNLTSRTKSYPSYTGFIRTVNTFPEVAIVGYNKVDLAKMKRSCRKAIVYLKDVTASKIHRIDYGFVKILADHSGHILGATIVAPGASLMAEEFAIAIRHNLTVLELASTPHISNSFNYAIKLAARQLVK